MQQEGEIKVCAIRSNRTAKLTPLVTNKFGSISDFTSTEYWRYAHPIADVPSSFQNL